MNMSTAEVIDKGLHCLSTHLGAGETELFISTILRERFDYTKWRQNFVDDIKTFDDLDALLEKTKSKAKFNGTPDVII